MRARENRKGWQGAGEHHSAIPSILKEACTMDLDKLLADLRKERDLIDEAISHLERLPTGTRGVSSRRRGRANANEPPQKAHAAGAGLD